MLTFWKNLTYAWRILRRSPGFTAAVVVVLAVGIGVNSAMFSLIDAVLLRALPFHHPEELVMLWEHPPGYAHNRVSPLNFVDWSEQNHAFSSLAAISGGSNTLLAANGTPERIPGQEVTTSFFDVLGVKPVAGRMFTADDARQQAKVVVISESMWRSRFGSDPTLIGKTLVLDDENYTVIGIAPAEFQIVYASSLWTPFYPRRSPEQRRMHYLLVIGRLRPEMNLAQARADMGTVANNIARIAPETNAGWTATVEPLRDALVGHDLRLTTLVLGGAVGFVLLIACANVANLLLARGAGRTREMAVRLSLGATRIRIVAQLLTESLSLAGMGGLGGVAIAWMIVRTAPSFLPHGTLPAGLLLRFDGRAVAIAAAIALTTGVLFGLAPAWQGSRVALFSALRASGLNLTGGTARFRAVLAAGEVAISMALIVGAGLLLRTLDSLNKQDPGFHADRVLTMYVSLPLKHYSKPESALRFYQAAQQEIAAIPGVRSVGWATSLPLDGWNIGQGFEITGHPARTEAEQPAAHYQMVSEDYFKTLGIEVLRGRGFTERDTAAATPVCVVNEEMVRQYFRDRDPIGATLTVQAMDPAGPKPVLREVVGVIRQVKVEGLGEHDNSLEIYVPLAQNAWFGAALSVAATGDPTSLTPAVRRAIAAVDKQQPITQVRTMQEVAAQSIAQPRFRAELLGSFALWSVLLAAFGVFSVLAFSVSQRAREFGIRMAVGASTGNILRLVVRGGLAITAAGIGAGLVASLLLARLLGSLLYEVKPIDPVTFVAAPALMVLVALAACVTPALRASRVNPVSVLRQE
ncbi:MAG TPA: ABC transporter permease [Candidatus Angelobacter sp.]